MKKAVWRLALGLLITFFLRLRLKLLIFCGGMIVEDGRLRLDYILLLMTCKMNNGLTPSYLSDLNFVSHFGHNALRTPACAHCVRVGQHEVVPFLNGTLFPVHHPILTSCRFITKRQSNREFH